MNKAITDGVQLMPPAFANGLDVWSSGDGTPGTDTYQNASNAAYVPADQDFGGCLEIQKTSNTTRVRYMGETPLLPGCYLQVKVRIKVLSGSLPTVRIAGFAGQAGGGAVSGVVTTGPTTTLTSYGDVHEISAIIGVGSRTGVDLIWGGDAIYGHFGLDLTGPNGGIVRIDDIEISDITSVFLRDILSTVDVRDYGAVGNGTTDDADAFDAANAAANGRMLLVPEGSYYINSDMTIDTTVRFEGTIVMPTDKTLLLTRQFDLATYIDAMGNEELAFRKAFQALLNNADHESLDMGGRKVAITGPIDMQAAVPDRTSFATRRVIRNGQLEATTNGDWDTYVAASQATYSTSDSKKLTEVTNIANIEVGSVVEGIGVGRAIYVKSVDVTAKEITLSQPLYDAVGRQSFTFHRHKYVLDFSGFSALSKFALDDLEIQCNGVASAVLLAPSGLTFHVRDCHISRPKNHGISSHGTGCQGILIDRCQFLSSEDDLDVSERVSIGINTNANDIKIRHNRATRHRHFGIFGGTNTQFIGNHFFQGDGQPNGIRTAGIVVANGYCSAIITNNYVNNCFVEWTNEYDPSPDFTSGFSFSAMSISDNIFLSGAVAPWFSYIVVKPHGSGHFLNGVSITGKKFRSFNGSIDRAERVDTSFADLNRARMKDVSFMGNSFHNISEQVSNPLRIAHTVSTSAATWVVDTEGLLPFEGHTLGVDSVTAIGRIRNSSGTDQFIAPYAELSRGSQNDQVNLQWGTAVRGEVQISVRMDD
ncbi:MAG: right-handed parallel beta-helix repeat-containing protein [Ascidiaceihabitans sp.]|nr:right-handed parallel beta-helix repeat-containing protein [Ascidiaceihabitans sp.]